MPNNSVPTVDIEELSREIVRRLKPLDPDRIVLFGSYAWGSPTEESDVDLYVVTGDDYVPANWKERNALYLNVARAVRDLRREVPIDLIVHTRKMSRAFMEEKSMFSRKILAEGRSLYEKTGI